MIRIIGGSFRGTRLATLPGRDTRPMLDRVREAVAGILAPRIPGALVWDLFAGTGGCGLEALSRGAREVLFVERSGPALRILRANLERLPGEARDRCRVVRGDAWAPPGAGSLETSPDLVFLDPPYPQVRRAPKRALASAARLLARTAQGGTLVFHFPKGLWEAGDLASLGEVDLRVWGGSSVAFLRASL